jgi:queuine tRNA-ribosyltransferase subunit QTRTD1
MKMKKFSVEKIGALGCERLGHWELASHAPISTPGVWLTTSAAGIPNLTPQTLEMADLQPHFSGLLVPFEKHARSVDVYESFGKGFLAFSGLKPTPTLMTVLDPMSKTRSGYNTNKSVSVWGECNQREVVDPAHLMKGFRALKPDAFVALCDSDIPKDGTAKRIMKATRNTLKFTCDCLDDLRQSNDDDGVVIGAIEGGFDKVARAKESKTMADLDPLDGFLLDGFHTNGITALEVNLDEVEDVLKDSVLPLLPSDKPRFYFGMTDPSMILRLVRLGVDFFETSYVYHMTEQGFALTFPNEKLGQAVQVSEDLVSKITTTATTKTVSEKPYLDLNDEVFKNDFGPLSLGCSCYACRKHTRGYVNHLLATRELLASVLLVIHNLHHYGVFFASIRDAISQDRLEELCDQMTNKNK